jgi:hypothetical protein
LTDDPYGSARLRVFDLPNGQFFVIMDRAGFLDAPGRVEEWQQLRQLVMSRLGPECVGFLRFAGEVGLF